MAALRGGLSVLNIFDYQLKYSALLGIQDKVKEFE
jgi:hypothetical protein